MAGASVAITGSGNVTAIDVMLPSNANPGTFWARVSSVTDIPQTGIGVTLVARNVTMNWTDCRMVKRPRVFRSGADILLQDSRWKLREVVIGKSYNQPLLDGRVAEETSLSSLWSIIADLSGLLFRTENLPNILPPVKAGMTAQEAANWLLEASACRMVYDPVTGEYVVSPAGTGALPSTTERLRRPVQVQRPQSIQVRPAPTLYEDEISCNAVVVDADGSFAEMAGNAEFALMDFFTGFETEGNSRRELLRNSAFRLWKPVGVTFPEALTADRIRIIGHRLQSLGAGKQVGPQATSTGMLNYPLFHYVPDAASLSLAGIEYSPESNLFIAERPVLAVNAGAPRTTVGIICAYQKLDAQGKAFRETESRTISGATGPVEEVLVDWVQPVDTNSALDGVDESQWPITLNAVADALATKYSAAAEHVRVRSLIPSGGSGQVGAVRYRAMLGGMATLETSLHLNYEPSGASSW